MQQIKKRAFLLLARREHSVLELQQKLTQREFDPALVAKVLEQLVAEGLLCNDRFAESLARQRHEQGYGPVRIRQELLSKGVDEGLISQNLQPFNGKWVERGKQVRCKRFAEELPEDDKEKARQQRFLQYRGFTAEHIRSIMRDE